MDAAEDSMVVFMDYFKEHWAKIHSTGPLERLNGEIKRRTDVVGIFTNEAAITRLVGAILHEQNDERAVQRRYMTLEALAPVSDDLAISLSARYRKSPLLSAVAATLLHYVVGHDPQEGGV